MAWSVRGSGIGGAALVAALFAFATPASAANLLNNPGFESGLSPYWERTSNSSWQLIDWGHSGSRSVRLTGDNSNGYHLRASGSNRPVSVSGATYHVSAWVRGTASTDGRGVWLNLIQGSLESEKWITLNQDAWQQVSLTHRATRGGDSLVIRVERRSAQANESFRIDDVAIELDTSPPETTITAGPSGTIPTDSASFSFASSESGSSFSCRIDGATWSACSSPRSYTGLTNGPHTFEVRATDASGNTDPSPASRTFTVGVPSCSTGPFSEVNPPPVCWRPYSDASPFNRLVPGNAPVLDNSQQIVDRWIGFGDLNAMRFKVDQVDPGDDYDHPVYFSDSSDPLYTVQCTEWVSSCEVHGLQVRIPGAAQPAGGSDAHLAVIDEAGWEWDFWKVASKPTNGGTLETSHGGRTPINGDGLGSNATASHFGLAAGVIRPQELAGGEINHALFMVVNCTNGQSVAPAGGTGRSCSSIGLSDVNAPRMGEHFVLDMTEAEINALPTAEWRKTILRAMARHGLYVGDTGGGSLKTQAGVSWTSFGIADPWVAVAQQFGVPRPGGNFYDFDLRTVINWQAELKVVDPCASQGTC